MYEAIPLSDLRQECRNYLGCWERIVFSGVAVDEGQHFSPVAVYIWAGPRLEERTDFFEAPTLPDKICLFKIIEGTAAAWPMFDSIVDQQSWQVQGKNISFAQFRFHNAAFLTSDEDKSHYPSVLEQNVGIGPKLLLAGSFANSTYLFNEFGTPVRQQFHKATYLYHSLQDATSHLIGVRTGIEQWGTLLAVLNIPIRLQAKREDAKLVYKLELPSNLERMPREMRYVRLTALGQEDVIIPQITGKREQNHTTFSSSLSLAPGEEVKEVVLHLGDKRVASVKIPAMTMPHRHTVESQIKALPKATIERKELVELRQILEPPIEIQESLVRFKQDYPDPSKVAFIMMEFGKTEAHKEITKAIRAVLNNHDITGVRADDKYYHDDLHYNVLTYLYGCGFGVAVFERIEREEFNPNASLEVGYMFALRKPVCLLKDKTLKTLPADIIGKLYRPFDPQHPAQTIPPELSKWLSDKGIA